MTVLTDREKKLEEFAIISQRFGVVSDGIIYSAGYDFSQKTEKEFEEIFADYKKATRADRRSLMRQVVKNKKNYLRDLVKNASQFEPSQHDEQVSEQ